MLAEFGDGVADASIRRVSCGPRRYGFDLQPILNQLEVDEKVLAQLVQHLRRRRVFSSVRQNGTIRASETMRTRASTRSGSPPLLSLGKVRVCATSARAIGGTPARTLTPTNPSGRCGGRRAGSNSTNDGFFVPLAVLAREFCAALGGGGFVPRPGRALFLGMPLLSTSSVMRQSECDCVSMRYAPCLRGFSATSCGDGLCVRLSQTSYSRPRNLCAKESRSRAAHSPPN